jgi:TraM recognition site of TraD and TraG
VTRKTSNDETGAPVLLALDEAGNIPLHNLSEALGVGRGRRCGIVLGYQNIGQLYKQHGRDGAQAILGSIGTMVFLPGLDAETSQYAAKRIGRTTVLQHSVVDATGDIYDQDRLSETGRDLLDAAELRQMPEHTQAVAITGSAPPIKFGFPPCGKTGPLAHPLPRDIAQPQSLNDAEAAFAMRRSEKANEKTAMATTESLMPIGAASDEIHPANELYPAFDSGVLPDGAQGSIDSIIDALLDSLPLPKSDTAASPPPPTPDSTTPFDVPLNVDSTLGKLSLRGFGDSDGKEAEG